MSLRRSGIGISDHDSKSAGQNKKQNRRRSRGNEKPNSASDLLPPPPNNQSPDVMAINIPTVTYRTAGGEVLPILSGWLRKKSRKRRTWDRRYFYIEPTEKRIYYLQNGPDDGIENNSGGMYHSFGKLISSTYHKIVDGDNSGESFLDLRLIPDIYISDEKKSDRCVFDIDLGYRTMKVRCDTQAQCRHWVEKLNKWREWAHTNHGSEGGTLSSRSPSGNSSGGYSTDGSQGDMSGGEETIRGRLPCEPESSAKARSEWVVVKRKNSRNNNHRRGAEDTGGTSIDSRGSSIASDDSEYGSRRLENFFTSPPIGGGGGRSGSRNRRFDSSDSISSNAFASLSYNGSESRSNSSGHSSGSGNNSRGSSASRIRKFPGSGSVGRNSGSRISESYDTARSATEGRSTSGSAWGSEGEDEDAKVPFSLSPIQLDPLLKRQDDDDEFDGVTSSPTTKKNRHHAPPVVEMGQLQALSLGESETSPIFTTSPQPSSHVLGRLQPISLGGVSQINQDLSPMEDHLGKLEALSLDPSSSSISNEAKLRAILNTDLPNTPVITKNHRIGSGTSSTGGSFEGLAGAGIGGGGGGRLKKVKAKKTHTKSKRKKDKSSPETVHGSGGGGRTGRRSPPLQMSESSPIQRIEPSLKLSQVTRLPRPTDAPSPPPPPSSMSRSTSIGGSSSLSQQWKDYPTQLNVEHDDDEKV